MGIAIFLRKYVLKQKNLKLFKVVAVWFHIDLGYFWLRTFGIQHTTRMTHHTKIGIQHANVMTQHTKTNQRGPLRYFLNFLCDRKFEHTKSQKNQKE